MAEWRGWLVVGWIPEPIDQRTEFEYAIDWLLDYLCRMDRDFKYGR